MVPFLWTLTLLLSHVFFRRPQHGGNPSVRLLMAFLRTEKNTKTTHTHTHTQSVSQRGFLIIGKLAGVEKGSASQGKRVRERKHQPSQQLS